MRITKFGHSCLLVEEGNARILIDPGSWGNPPDGLDGIDVVLVTHEHHDHYYTDHLRKILTVNPQAIIYSNESVRELAKKENIPVQILAHKQEILVK